MQMYHSKIIRTLTLRLSYGYWCFCSSRNIT